MKVLIVGRTRMGEGLCIGGITTNLENVRIQPESGYAQPNDAPYQIGEVWDLPLVKVPGSRPPHVEDMRMTGPGRREDRIEDVGAWLLRGISPWRGSAEELFDGAVQRMDSGRVFVGADNVPAGSLGFWIPDRPLVRRDWEDKVRYEYTDYSGNRWRFSYAGVGPSLRMIPAGLLVRVSLARWWSPSDGSLPESCYAQVSGWFVVDAEATERRGIPAPTSFVAPR